MVGLPWMLLTVPLGLGGVAEGSVLGGLGFAFMPVLIAAAVTFTAMVLVGLPVTAALRAAGKEYPGIYALLGGVFGLLIPALAIILIGSPKDMTQGGLILVGMGGVAGAIAATIWGRHRKARRLARTRRDHTNPVHDLLF